MPVPIRSLLVLGCALCLTAGEEPVARGLKPMAITAPDGQTVTTITSSKALIIGNSAYTSQAWGQLAGVREDVAAVRAALERHGFAVTVVTDLAKAAMVETIDAFVADHGGDANGRVVIYYAGHGYTRGGANGVGYLVPTDAPAPNDRQFTAKAYPIGQMKIKAAEITARHVLFAFDCCFGGSVFTPLRGAAVDTPLSEAGAPVRLYLTAGAADEQVPDVSFFRQEFVAGIDGRADINRDGWVTGKELSFHLTQAVRDRARAAGLKLTPQAGVSEQEGFNRGDIVFQVPVAEPVVRTAATAPPPTADFSLDDVKRDDATVQAWTTWQGKMAGAFTQVKALDADPQTSAAAKRIGWQKFLSAFAADNPLSTEDEAMRATAVAAVQRYTTAPAPTTGAVPDSPAAVVPQKPTTPAAPAPASDPAVVQDRYGRWIGRWSASDGSDIVANIGWKEISISTRTSRWGGYSDILRFTIESMTLNGDGVNLRGRHSQGAAGEVAISVPGPNQLTISAQANAKGLTFKKDRP